MERLYGHWGLNPFHLISEQGTPTSIEKSANALLGLNPFHLISEQGTTVNLIWKAQELVLSQSLSSHLWAGNQVVNKLFLLCSKLSQSLSSHLWAGNVIRENYYSRTSRRNCLNPFHLISEQGTGYKGKRAFDLASASSQSLSSHLWAGNFVN